MWFAAAATVFIDLHTADGSAVQVSPHSIVSMHGRRQGSHFVEGTACLINLADGKFVAVKESCEDVTRLIEQSED